MNNKRVIFAAAAAAALALAAGGGAFLLLRADPSAHLADGRFEADCCGTLELQGGEMVLNGRRRVSYSVGRDAAGPYVLPRPYYVGGLESEGFEVDGTRPAMKLRLDRLPRPETIRLPADGGDFLLRRKAARAGKAG